MKTLQVKRVKTSVIDFPGLGQRIKEAREKDERSLVQICKECDISRAYWYQLEAEDMRSAVTEEIIRRIEVVLDIDVGVSFDD